MKLILIDNGHGLETKGKRSPNSLYIEAEWTREIAYLVATSTDIKNLPIKVELLVPEKEDIDLQTRVARVNEHCKEYGKDEVCLISIHSNASGDGTQWMCAKGWSVYTSPGKTKSDEIATILYDKAEERFTWPKAIRIDMGDGDKDFESNLYILKNTKCPAVLIENFFHDNEEDYIVLMSSEGKRLCAEVIIETIKEICARQL